MKYSCFGDQFDEKQGSELGTIIVHVGMEVDINNLNVQGSRDASCTKPTFMLTSSHFLETFAVIHILESMNDI